MNEWGYQPGDAWIRGVTPGHGFKINTSDGEVGLNHSCDDWCIGDADNVRAMIADLQTLLQRIEWPGVVTE